MLRWWGGWGGRPSPLRGGGGWWAPLPPCPPLPIRGEGALPLRSSWLLHRRGTLWRRPSAGTSVQRYPRAGAALTPARLRSRVISRSGRGASLRGWVGAGGHPHPRHVGSLRRVPGSAPRRPGAPAHSRSGGRGVEARCLATRRVVTRGTTRGVIAWAAIGCCGGGARGRAWGCGAGAGGARQPRRGGSGGAGGGGRVGSRR
jgi:hypothetical protein